MSFYPEISHLILYFSTRSCPQIIDDSDFAFLVYSKVCCSIVVSNNAICQRVKWRPDVIISGIHLEESEASACSLVQGDCAREVVE